MIRHTRAAQMLLVVVICYVIAASFVGIIRHLIVPQPSSPWEAAQIVEAWRAANALPVYESPVTGHATHMYGAFAPHALGLIFRVTGPSLFVARIAALLVSLLLVVAALSVFARPANLMVTAIGVALLIGADVQTGSYFTAVRPDMFAMLVGLCAAVVLYKGEQNDSLLLILGGSALVVLAFFFKQPMAMAGGIPFIATLLDERRRNFKRLAQSLIPVLSVVIAIVICRIVAPWVYFYMVDMPGSYRLSMDGFLTTVGKLVIAVPLLWVCAALRLRESDAITPTERWLIAALIVTIPLSAFTAAKVGGTFNSWWPAILSAHTATIYLLSRREVPAIVVAVLLFAGAARVHTNLGYFTIHDDYGDTREVIARLSGTMAAPENPLLVLEIPKAALRNIYLEYDAAPVQGNWPPLVPCYAWREVVAARYLIDAKAWGHDLLTSQTISAAGYQRVYESENYAIWERPPGRNPLETRCYQS